MRKLRVEPVGSGEVPVPAAFMTFVAPAFRRRPSIETTKMR